MIDMIRTLMLVRFGKQTEGIINDYPEPWQRLAREGELSSFMKLMDAVREARKLRLNQVTWQAVVEQLLLSLMEEKSKWST